MSRTDDTEIEAAYARLASSLAPPTDAPARIETRLRNRRRHRRQGLVLACALLLTGAGAVGLGATQGDDSSLVTDRSGPTNVGSSALALDLPDGSTHDFVDFRIRCEATEGGDLITASTPRELVGDRLLEPWLYFEALVDDVEDGAVFDLPFRSSARQGTQMVLFAALAEDPSANNEVSSAQPGGSGTVEVVSASCGPTPHLTMIVDAVLGSEVSQDPVRVVGRLDE